MGKAATRRQSRQRAVLLEELRADRSHPTARQLYDRVRRRLPHVSLGTIYRNLDLLCRCGKVQRLTGAGEARFDADTSLHNHVRCVRCGRIADLPGPSIELPLEELDETTGYEIIGYRLDFLGVCPACQDAEKGQSFLSGSPDAGSGNRVSTFTRS